MKWQSPAIKKTGFLSRLVPFILFQFVLCSLCSVNAEPIHLVSAENMYGNIAQQIGGNGIHVETILNNPDQDPHLFELTPRLGQKIQHADLVLVNGLGYDSWMNRLLSGYPPKNIISVQTLLGRKAGDNPHLWYDVKAVEILARTLEQRYSALQPQSQSFYHENLVRFLQDSNRLNQRMDKIRSKYAELPVAATEPVFGLMAHQLGFSMLEEPYQWVIMNEGEPTPQQISQFVQDMKTHKIRILFYNNQVSTPATEQLKKLAKENHIPVVGVEETMPPSLSYQQWMNQVLDKVEIALSSQA